MKNTPILVIDDARIRLLAKVIRRMDEQKSQPLKSAPAPRRVPWLWVFIGGALLLIAAGLILGRTSLGANPAPSQAGSTPQLTVDKTTIDEGYVRFDVPVRSAFNLSNAGTQPLQILGEPQVELVEGC